MKTVAPDYYTDFRCKAGSCKHTCCAGWEIDIDEETLKFYQNIGGKIGKKLADSVSLDGSPHFILEGEDERCPMLDENGLCRLISEYGKEVLCQICADHPRFRNFFSDRTEIGLGLCCEAAGELILGKPDKVRLITLSDDADRKPLSDEEKNLFATREKMLGILQDRQQSVSERMNRLLAVSGTRDSRSMKELFDLFLSFERLDEKWTALLSKQKESDSDSDISFDKAGQTILEQFAVYLIFRYTPYLESKDAVMSVSGMYRIFESLCRNEKGENGKLDLKKAVEIARLLSSEVEYSDENLERLFGDAYSAL